MANSRSLQPSPLPQRRPSRVTATEPQTMASSPGMSTRATSSDQRSPCDKLAACSILSGGIRHGSSFLNPPRNLGVGTKTVMPRRSASARSGRCGESGLTLMAVALFHGSMSRSRAAATSAPAKFGIRPCGGNGKRATPSALSLSQTHCRAALLSAKSRAMTESGAARPGDSQGRNLLQKHLGEILASQTSHPSIEKPCSMGRPSRRPTAIQAALRRRRAFGSGGARKYGCDQTGCGGLSVVEQPASLIGALNSPRDKSADKQQSLETKPISRGTESSNPAPSSRESCELAISRRIADCLSRSRTDTLSVHIAVRCPCSCSGDVRCRRNAGCIGGFEEGEFEAKISGHPPFPAQVILNGHEYVACQARKAYWRRADTS